MRQCGQHGYVPTLCLHNGIHIVCSSARHALYCPTEKLNNHKLDIKSRKISNIMEQTSIKRQKTKIKKSQQPGKLPDMQENAMLCHQTNCVTKDAPHTIYHTNWVFCFKFKITFSCLKQGVANYSVKTFITRK